MHDTSPVVRATGLNIILLAPTFILPDLATTNYFNYLSHATDALF